MSTLGNNLLAQYYAQNTIPRRGLVMYAPMDRVYVIGDTLPTGQTIGNIQGERINPIVFDEYKGIPCLVFVSTNYSSIQGDYPIDGSDFSISEWVCVAASPYSGQLCAAWWNTKSSSPRVALGIYKQQSSQTTRYYIGFTNGSSSDINYIYEVELNTWHHCCLSSHGGTTYLYIDGMLVGERQTNNTIQQGAIVGQFGAYQQGNSQRLAALRVYNRVLSQDEITLLAHEFTPTP